MVGEGVGLECCFHLVEIGSGKVRTVVVVAGLDSRSGDEGIALQYVNEFLIQKGSFFYFIFFYFDTLFFLPKKYARYTKMSVRRRAVTTWDVRSTSFSSEKS